MYTKFKFVTIFQSGNFGDSSVRAVTAYGLEGRGEILGRGRRIVSTPQGPDLLWGPHSILPNRYRRLFPGGEYVAQSS
jgi:hypothetical protein